MCGIIGQQFLRPDRRTATLMAALIPLTESRGRNAWGVWTPTWNVRRGIGPLSQAIPARAYRDQTSIMLHMRLPSCGANTKENAHPFSFGNIIGCHNGSIRNHEELNKKYGRKFQVDSMHIFANINEDKSTDDLEGYGAITYVDKRELSRIYMCRWNGGSLEAAEVYDKKHERLGSVWASVGFDLETALNMAGFEFQRITIKERHLHYAESGLIHVEDEPLSFGFRVTRMDPISLGDGHRRTVQIQNLKSRIMTRSHIGDGGSVSRNTQSDDSETCASCFRVGFLIEFADTGVRICPTCHSEWSNDPAMLEKKGELAAALNATRIFRQLEVIRRGGEVPKDESLVTVVSERQNGGRLVEYIDEKGEKHYATLEPDTRHSRIIL